MRVKRGQSFVDVAIVATGVAANAEVIADENGCEVTDTVPAGTVVVIPDGLQVDDCVVMYYGADNVMPATALRVREMERTGGIGSMGVDVNFIIG